MKRSLILSMMLLMTTNNFVNPHPIPHQSHIQYLENEKEQLKALPDTLIEQTQIREEIERSQR